MILSVTREKSYGRYNRKLYNQDQLVEDNASINNHQSNIDYLHRHPVIIPHSLSETMTNLDVNVLAHLLHQYPTAEEVFRLIICATNSSNSPVNKQTAYGYYQLEVSKRNENTIYLLRYQEVLPLIMKIHHSSNDGLLHEYIMGIVLNQLRPMTSNFMYMYDYCRYQSQTAIFAEYIPGVPLTEFITTSSVDDFIAITMQIMYSLEIAQHRYRFVHNDLHAGNIIITDRYPESRVMTYHRPNGQSRKLTTRYTATIIDYDLVSLTVDGIRHGNSILNYNITSRFNPLIDVNRFIHGVGFQAAKVNNRPLVETVFQMWQLIYVEQDHSDFYESLRDLVDYYYVIQSPVDDNPHLFTSFINRLEQRWNCTID